ncbi:MAG: hypothetical protein C3L25_14180, partial [Candidatus Sedimenticola endophacoides]
MRNSLTIAMGAALVSLAQGASAMSLQEAVQSSLQSYPTIQQALAGRQAIEADLGVAKSRYLPSIDFELNYGREWSNNPTTRARTGSDDTWLNRRDSALTLSQSLLDGGARQGEVERQEALLKGAGFNLKDVSETLAADVVFAYIDVVRHRETLKLAQENLQVHARILEDVRRRQECRYLVKDFGTSQSPKSTRQRDSRYCPDRPALITTPSRTL